MVLALGENSGVTYNRTTIQLLIPMPGKNKND